MCYVYYSIGEDIEINVIFKSFFVNIRVMDDKPIFTSSSIL
jgi:hypothetical protein